MSSTRNRGSKVAALAAGLAGLALAVPAQADDELVVEKLQHGEINWTKKTVLATGSGAPDLKQPNVAAVRLNAERAAVLNAYRNVLETLRGVRVTASLTGEQPLADNQVRTQVQGLVQGCKTVDTRYYSDGGVDVVVRCPLDGGLSAVLAPVKERRPVSDKGEKKYTGLVIDAVGTKAQPAIAPRILDDAGAELYSREAVSPSVLRSSGAAVYTRTVELAKKDPRAGSNPLVLKAAAVGAVASDLVVSKEDAAKLAAVNQSFLADGNVVIATDGP